VNLKKTIPLMTLIELIFTDKPKGSKIQTVQTVHRTVSAP